MSTKKPRKPYAEFPLFAHANGQWAKKIRGRLHYFGLWEDPDGALAKYRAEVDDLQAGRTPTRGEGLTVREAAFAFLAAKEALVESGDLEQRTFNDYRYNCRVVTNALGPHRHAASLQPRDFEQLRSKLAEGRGPVTIGTLVRTTRSVFKYAYEVGYLSSPMRFGPHFKVPSRRTLRRHRQSQGSRLFTQEDLRRAIIVAPQPMRAMILLGINCGFGNTDVGELDAQHVQDEWIEYPRPKTGIERRAPLWEETRYVLRDARERRPSAVDADGRDAVFLTKYGHRWTRMKGTTQLDAVSSQFTKVLKAAGLKRPGLSFYAIRHTFETVAGPDQAAINCIMGHADPTISAHYREGVPDERLVATAEIVREWLFPRVSPNVSPATPRKK